MVKKPGSKGKLNKKTAPAAPNDRSAAIETASLPDEHRIRERAYGIWIEEGRPHGRDLLHWQRARYQLQQETP
jgi:hypothetical protein